MIRERLSKREAAVQDGFRLRGLGEVSRIEALSDGVIAFAITLLYHHAYRKRRELELNEIETFDTWTMMQDNVLNAAIGLLSVTLAVAGGGRFAFFAGFAYWLIAPAQFAHGSARGRRRRHLEQHLAHDAESPLNAAADV